MVKRDTLASMRRCWLALTAIGLAGCELVLGFDGVTGGESDAGSDGTTFQNSDASTTDARDETSPRDATLPEAESEASLTDAGADVASDAAVDSPISTFDAAFDSPPDGPFDSPADSPDGDAGGCTDVSSGLLGYWTMDSTSIVGAQLFDNSGNQNKGTLVGFSAPVTVPGKFGQALSFPTGDASAYVLVQSVAFDEAAAHENTISLWFYRSNVDVNDVLMLLPNSPRYDLWLTTNATTDTYLCFNTGRGECFGLQDDTLHDRWVHVVAVFSNGATSADRLYIDGVSRSVACVADAGDFASCTGITATAGSPVSFGGQTDFFYHGLLDEVRMYGRALTQNEVTTLYNGAACP